MVALRAALRFATLFGSVSLLGSCLVFCRQTYSPGSFLDQPLIRDARAVLEHADAEITPRALQFLPPELR